MMMNVGKLKLALTTNVKTLAQLEIHVVREPSVNLWTIGQFANAPQVGAAHLTNSALNVRSCKSYPDNGFYSLTFTFLFPIQLNAKEIAIALTAKHALKMNVLTHAH